MSLVSINFESNANLMCAYNNFHPVPWNENFSGFDLSEFILKINSLV